MNVNQYFHVPKIISNPPLVLDPTDIPGLSAWYDFTDLATITKDGSNLISQINDKSGNSRHAIQVTPASQPLYQAAGLEGYPCASFDGVDDWLEATFTLPDYPFTVILVTSLPASYPYSYYYSNSRYHYILSSSAPSAQIRGVTANQTVSLFNAKVGQIGAYSSRLTASYIDIAGTAGVAELSQINSGSNTSIWVDATKLFLGRLRPGTFGTSKICECIQYNSELTDEELLALFQYVSLKYGGLPVPTSL